MTVIRSQNPSCVIVWVRTVTHNVLDSGIMSRKFPLSALVNKHSSPSSFFSSSFKVWEKARQRSLLSDEIYKLKYINSAVWLKEGPPRSGKDAGSRAVRGSRAFRSFPHHHYKITWSGKNWAKLPSVLAFCSHLVSHGRCCAQLTPQTASTSNGVNWRPSSRRFQNFDFCIFSFNGSHPFCHILRFIFEDRPRRY